MGIVLEVPVPAEVIGVAFDRILNIALLVLVTVSGSGTLSDVIISSSSSSVISSSVSGDRNVSSRVNRDNYW